MIPVILNFNGNRKKVLNCGSMSLYNQPRPIIRTMFSVVKNSQVNMKIICPNTLRYIPSYNASCRQSYATYRVHTPEPCTSSEESLKNNPPVSLYRKKGSKIIQHSEVIEEKCAASNCSNKLCDTPCGPVKESQAIGHLGHSEEHNTNLLSTKDVNGENVPQYMKKYEKGLTLESQSAHPEKDAERTERLLKILHAIGNNNDKT